MARSLSRMLHNLVAGLCSNAREMVYKAQSWSGGMRKAMGWGGVLYVSCTS